jgi:hypothetical protein
VPRSCLEVYQFQRKAVTLLETLNNYQCKLKNCKGETKMSLSNGGKASFFLVISIITLFVIYNGLSLAADDNVCTNYAKTAVLQQEQNQKYNCGFSGPEWNSDFNYHKRWCVGTNVTPNLIDKETAKRVDKLMGCNNAVYPAGADKWCSTYSIIAIGQNAANISNQFGLSGPEWNSNYAYHYKWCVGAPRSASESGMNKRMEELKRRSK